MRDNQYILIGKCFFVKLNASHGIKDSIGYDLVSDMKLDFEISSFYVTICVLVCLLILSPIDQKIVSLMF